MPFRSAKQRTYLRINEPDVYKRWVAEHGEKVVPTPKKTNDSRKTKKRDR